MAQARDVPRLLINRELVGSFDIADAGGAGPTGADPLERLLSPPRDAFFEGDCDAGVTELARLAGLGDHLQARVAGGGGGAAGTAQASR